MKLKYYLRGLGIGILVTAVIMGVSSGKHKESLTDQEIKERAAALGMVEPGGSLADLSTDESDDADESDDTPEPGGAIDSDEMEDTEEAVATATPSASPQASTSASPAATATSASPSTKSTASTSPSATPSDRTSPSATPSASPDSAAVSASPSKSPASPRTDVTDSNSFSLVIQSGDSSYSVAQKLENAGIVASASDFDSYLCSKGYDRRLRTGTYVIPMDAGPAEIAEILVP